MSFLLAPRIYFGSYFFQITTVVPAVAPCRKSKLTGNSKTTSFLLTLHDDGG